MTLNHTTIPLLLNTCNCDAFINHNANIWYAGYLICDPQRGHDSRVEKCWSRVFLCGLCYWLIDSPVPPQWKAIRLVSFRTTRRGNSTWRCFPWHEQKRHQAHKRDLTTDILPAGINSIEKEQEEREMSGSWRCIGEKITNKTFQPLTHSAFHGRVRMAPRTK